MNTQPDAKPVPRCPHCHAQTGFEVVREEVPSHGDICKFFGCLFVVCKSCHTVIGVK